MSGEEGGGKDLKNAENHLGSTLTQHKTKKGRNQETQRRLYLVFICPKCGAPRYAEADRKTALCFGCGYQIPLDPAKIRVIFKTERRQEAVEALQRYKMQRGREAASR